MNRFSLQIVLFFTALALTAQIYGVWTGESGVPGAAPAAGRKAAAAVSRFSRRTVEPPGFYEGMISDNLLAPERREIVPAAPEPEPEAEVSVEEKVPELKKVKIAGQEVILYGIMALGEFKSALVNNPFKGEDDPREKLWVRIGERLANLRVDDIQRDRLLLREGNKRYLIMLRDRNKPEAKGAVSTRTAGAARPTVINTAAAPRPAAKPPAGGGRAAAKSGGGDDGYIIVQTPFGPQRRRR